MHGKLSQGQGSKPLSLGNARISGSNRKDVVSVLMSGGVRHIGTSGRLHKRDAKLARFFSFLHPCGPRGISVCRIAGAL